MSPSRSDLPATIGLVESVRDELRADIRGLEHRMDARFKGVDANFKSIGARFNEVDARFNEVDARFNEVDARFNKIDARFDSLEGRFSELISLVEDQKSSNYRMETMLEQQHSENRIMLEKLMGLDQRQSNLEQRQDSNDNFIRDLAQRAQKPTQ